MSPSKKFMTITPLELFINLMLKTKNLSLGKSTLSLQIYTTAILKECEIGLLILVLQDTKVYI